MPSQPGELAAQLLDTLEAAVVREVEKPWGFEQIIDCGAFLLKVIFVDEGQRTSLQHHEVKEEVQIVSDAEQDGGMYLYTGAAEPEHHGEGEIVRVPPGVIHRTVGPCVLIEITTPENDDVIRHADDYDRVTSVVTPDDDTHRTKSGERQAYEKPTLTRGDG